MTIAELVAKISLKGGKESVATMQGLMKSTIATKAALIGAATALYKMSDAARQSALFLDMYQLNTGRSAENLQRMSFQAAQAGVSMSELGDTIEKLSQMNANARLGYGWDPILTRFGLTPGQDPVEQLNKIGAALRKLGASNPAEAHALASKAGLSDSMYYALMKMGTEQMNKQLILTDKERAAIIKLNQQWNKFWFYLKQIVIKIQALGATFQTGFVKVLTRAAQGFYELFSRIYKVIEASDDLKIAIAAVGVALAAAFAPELLVLAGVALVLEDIFTYFEGGDSITGKIVEWCKQSQEFQDIWLGVKTVFDLIITAIKGWNMIFDEILTPLMKLFEKIKSIPFLGDMVKMATNPVGYGLEQIGKARRMYDEYTGITPSVPMVGGSTVNQNNNTVIEVNGAGDPAQVADRVSSMQKQINQANAQQANLSEGNVAGGNRYGRPVLATN